MSIQPEGEELRKATAWIGEERKFHTERNLAQLIEEACLKFDLSPADGEFLYRFFKEKKK